MWQDILKYWVFKKEDFKLGIFFGIFIVVAVLVSVSSGSLTFKTPWTRQEFNLAPSPSNAVLGFPSYDNPTNFQFFISNLSGECISTTTKMSTGLTRQGIYCQGESVYIDNAIINIDKVMNSNEVTKPIKVSIYYMYNLTILLTIILFALPILAVWFKVSKILERKQEIENSKKRREIAKKFNVEPEDLDNLFDLINQE